MTKAKHPRVGAEVLSCRHRGTNEIHCSSPLIPRGHSRLVADDFKPGFHLEAGETKSDRCKSGQIRRRFGDLPTPDPLEGASNRKTCRAARPVYGGSPVFGQWHEWIPAPTYLEQMGRAYAPECKMMLR